MKSFVVRWLSVVGYEASLPATDDRKATTKFLLGSLEKFLQGFLHDHLQWYTLLGGDAAAVFVFRRVAGYGAVHTGNLDAHIAEVGRNRLPLATEHLAFFLAPPDPQGGSFGKDDLRQVFRGFRLREDGQQSSRAVLLHVHGRAKDVQRSGLEQA